MSYKHLFLFIALAIVFAIISLLVYLTKGHPSLIRKKLKIGAMIIAITSIYSCDMLTDETTTTCYAPVVPQNQIVLDSPDGSTIYLKENNIIHGEINNRGANEFSYALTDSTSYEYQKDDLTAKDGAFDEYYEEFDIILNDSLRSGTYNLDFFLVPEDQITDSTEAYISFQLTIINE